MKLTNEINELLVELVNLESIDNSQFLKVNVGMLCQNLIKVYEQTSNPKAQDLIVKIIDKSGYSLFASCKDKTETNIEFPKPESVQKLVSEARSSSKDFSIDEDDFMDLIPVNGYFH